MLFKKFSNIEKKRIVLSLLLFLNIFFLNSCICFFDPNKIKIITSRVFKQKKARLNYTTKNNQIIVKKNDTVYGIAKQNNIPIKSLIEYNKLRPPYILKIGQKLNLPPSPFHFVQKGDTLYSISRKYNVELASLARVNNISSPYHIYENQKLILPGSISVGKTPVPSKTTSKTKNRKTAAKKQNVNIPKPSARSSSKFSWPVKGKIIVSFGPQGKGRHNDGINIAAKKGTPVLAAENGVVAYSGSQLKSFGNLLLLKHDDNYMTAYAHNETITVKRGDKVKKGEQIAVVGKTGSASSYQLHFEIRKGTKALNPEIYLER